MTDPIARALRNAAYFGRRSRYYILCGNVVMAVELARAAYRWFEIAKGTK